MKPSPNLCKEWRNSQVTQWLLQDLEREISRLAHRSVDTALSYDTEFETVKNAIKNSSQVAALEIVYDMIDNISEEIEDD